MVSPLRRAEPPALQQLGPGSAGSTDKPGAGSLHAQEALSLELENNLTEADGATLTALQCAMQVSGIRIDSQLDPGC